VPRQSVSFWQEMCVFPDFPEFSTFTFTWCRLADKVPAHLSLRCQIDASLGRPSSNTLKRRHGRPRNRWLNLVGQDSNCSLADLWKRAIHRGHADAAVLAGYDGDDVAHLVNKTRIS